MLRTIERVLSEQYDVRTARLPSQGLAAATETSFDLAILDVRMPEVDGFTLMARLGEMQPDLDVILMTGSTDERDARLVRAIREKAFFFLTKPFDREVLLTLVQRCLEARRLSIENLAHVARLERELRTAQAFQQSLLPHRSAEHGGFEISFLYEPRDELCGDFCDFVLRDDAPGAILIADVSGHGAPAAMVTGMVKQAFHAAALEDFSPSAVLERIVIASRLFTDGKYATAMCVRIRPASDTLEYANAGHPPGLLLGSEGSVTQLEASAPIIHPALPYWHCEQRVVRMDRGDRLLLYTDGLTEALNSAGEEFGAERLAEVAARLAGPAMPRDSSGANLLAVVRDEVARFAEGRPLADDLTVMLLRRL
jgi:serine phosphatase RsbU (regulator of sigma subunit)/CheY-like chemotaxis protein